MINQSSPYSSKYFKPILTIAIPVFNKAHLFEFSFASVIEAALHLKHTSNELIDILVIDDYSTEDIEKSYNLVKDSYSYPTTRFYRNNKNLGRKENYKNIISNSLGKFVWTIGSDDFLYQHSLPILIKKLYNYPKVQVFVLNISYFDIKMNQLIPYKFGSNELSNYILDLGVSNSNSPNKDIYTKNLMELIHPKFNNVYLGAIMTTVVNRKEMEKSIRTISEPLIKHSFYNVCEWYINTYHLSMSFMTKASIYISDPMVIAGDGTRDWASGENGSVWSSDYPFILYKVVPSIVELHISNGLKGYKAYLSRNYISQIIGMLFLPNLFHGIFDKKFKYSFKELSLFKSFFYYMIFPRFYLGFFKSLLTGIKSIILNWIII